MTGASLRIGGRDITIATPETEDRMLTMLLWGQSGCGKTQLAETAPGDKLWLLFDPDGEAALPIDGVRGRNHFVRLYEEKDDVVLQFKSTNPLGIEAWLAEHPEVETIVFDSLTTFSEMALIHGVTEAKKTPKGRTSTLEDPGYAGFGHKKTYVMLAYTNILRLAKRTKRHVIFICHEDKPDTNDRGEFVGIGPLLGSSLVVEVPVKISEIWHITDLGNKNGKPIRRVGIRPSRGRSPMRTRCFSTDKDPEFELDYNAATNQGFGIAEIYELWKSNGFAKLPLPNSVEFSNIVKKTEKSGGK